MIVHDGLTRMYCHQEDLIYYLTVMNETYKMPPMPKGKGVREGIIKGMYRYRAASSKGRKAKIHLLGSVWSVTSYKELYQDAVETERWNLLHPGEKERLPYLRQLLAKEQGSFVAVSDYMKVLPAAVAQWFPGPVHCLGTDGFGRSDGRTALRDFFEVDARYITLAALRQLVAAGEISGEVLLKAVKSFKINPDKLNPHSD